MQAAIAMQASAAFPPAFLHPEDRGSSPEIWTPAYLLASGGALFASEHSVAVPSSCGHIDLPQSLRKPVRADWR
jgi:hypothetical protein